VNLDEEGVFEEVKGGRTMAHGKVTVLCKVPGHVIGTLPNGVVLGRSEGSAGVEKTGIKSEGLEGVPKRD